MSRRPSAMDAEHFDGGDSGTPAVPPVAVAAFAAMVALGLATVMGIARGPTGTKLLVFGMAGVALVGATLLLLPALLADERAARKLRRQYPDQPWMWRQDWATGRALSRWESTVNARWGVALLWNSVTAMFLFGAPILAREEGPRLGVFAFLVGLLGVGHVVRAMRASAHFRRFGRGVVALATVPTALGSQLRGTIGIRLPSRPNVPTTLTLTCVNRVVHGVPRLQWVRKIVLWRDANTVAPGAIIPLATGARIPIAFDVPADRPPTRDDDKNDTITWLLEAEVVLPGMDYHEEFEMPVFAATAG